MSRQCCPDCEDHPVLMEDLSCYFCKGSYTWVKNEGGEE